MQFYIFFFFCIRFLFFSFSVTDIFGLSEQLYPDCCSPLRRLCSRRFIFRSSVLIPPPSLRCFFPPLKKKKTHAKWVAVLFRCYVLNSRVCFKKPPFVWLCPAKQALPFKKRKKSPWTGALFGRQLEESVHYCILLGWSLYFYSHIKIVSARLLI